MSTPEELSTTYSFIPVLLADPVLSVYGDNALPLFAVGLFLGIEDYGSFATESLTDNPDDKKADIIYINEADGVACVAQGSTAHDWGKQEAKANKASDLNTAAAWLLRNPIEEVPETIRSHAKLLRDGLQQGTITKLVFAYAHNALESQNVENELRATSELVRGLAITAAADVEVVELGLRQIEALHLTSLGSIQVNDEIDLPLSDGACIRESREGWRAFVLPISGATLYDLYDEHKNALFSANLRDFIGLRKASGNVNNKIKDTAEREPGNFFIFNNGITIITKKAELNASLHIYGASVVNGAQTTGAIHAAGRAHAMNVSVLARIIVVDSESLIPRVVAANNTQNAIVAWDRRSNDAVQIRLGQEFEAKGLEYVHRRDNTRKPASAIFAEQVGQMLTAFAGDLQTAIRAKADIFELDSTYHEVFPNNIALGHVYAVHTLGRAYDKVKQDLKSKASGIRTDLERRQLNLLDYPASKQFLIRVIGDLREEIAGRALGNPKGFEVKQEFIGANEETVIGAWVKVINAILPTIVQALPAEEYQVVRSNEHTRSVVDKTKGIVAGADILKASFEDLRGLLKPG